MQNLERRIPENGSSPAQNEAYDDAVFDPASPKANGWRRKLIDQLDNGMKRLLQIEEIHQRLVKARELVANGSVHRIQLVKNHYTVHCDDGGDFLVDNGRCRCDGAQSRSSAIKGWCEHRTAVEIFKETRGERDFSSHSSLFSLSRRFAWPVSLVRAATSGRLIF